jgi:hypothetical protein
MKLQPIIAVTLSIMFLWGCRKDKPQEQETAKPSTQEGMSLDALVKVDNNWRLFSPIEILP